MDYFTPAGSVTVAGAAVGLTVYAMTKSYKKTLTVVAVHAATHYITGLPGGTIMGSLKSNQSPTGGAGGSADK